jgi:hypothetical protein
VVDEVARDEFVDDRVEQREVRPGPQCQMQVGLLGDERPARVDGDQLRRVGSCAAIEDPLPQDGLGLGDVVAEARDELRVGDIRVRAGLAVAAEALLQRLAGRRRAQPRVAVEMVAADSRADHDRQRVVVLDEQLARRVEAVRGRSLLVQQRPRAFHHARHGGAPVALDEPVAVADERTRQTVRRTIGLPAEEILRPKPAAVDAIGRPAAHADDAPLPHRDVHGIPVGVQDRGRLMPRVHVACPQPLVEEHVHPRGPGLGAAIWGCVPNGAAMRSWREAICGRSVPGIASGRTRDRRRSQRPDIRP